MKLEEKQSVHIVGGGLAGLLLGIRLRQNDVPTRLSEAGSYPRHRVCGEFMSGAGVDVLRQAGMIDPFLDRGARWGKSVTFFSEKDVLQRFELPRPALCLSRYAMDDALAEKFQDLNGDLESNARIRESEWDQEGTVCAVGRRRLAIDEGWRWYGLKIHTRNVAIESDLEMHLHRDAYIGACRIEDDRVNLCGLFRRPAENAVGEKPSPIELLRGLPGSILYEKTESAEFLTETQCAVAGLDLHPRSATDGGACRLGDALTMIPPLTGNGMSMALESAYAAVQPLVEYSEGKKGWNETVKFIANNLNSDFSERLVWARRIQQSLFSPIVRPVLLSIGKLFPPIWSFGFGKTR
jgi:flavin-dependent dehydrogenase